MSNTSRPVPIDRPARPGSHWAFFIHYPQRVLVQQGVFHGPAGAAGGVAAVECSREQHVLRADQHGRSLRFQPPAVRIFAAHQDVDARNNAARLRVVFAGFSISV